MDRTPRDLHGVARSASGPRRRQSPCPHSTRCSPRTFHHGRVDYGGLAAAPGLLHRFLADAGNAEPDRFSRDEQVAFWVNVYNARVLEAVIRRPGLESVLDPGRILWIPTLAFFREQRPFGSRTLSLNDIEHGILRERFRDPRVHFVLNCASRSCPDLPARALRAATLEADLDAARDAFLADRDRNRIGATGPSRCRRSSSGTATTSAPSREACAPTCSATGRGRRSRGPMRRSGTCATTGRSMERGDGERSGDRHSVARRGRGAAVGDRPTRAHRAGRTDRRRRPREDTRRPAEPPCAPGA